MFRIGIWSFVFDVSSSIEHNLNRVLVSTEDTVLRSLVLLDEFAFKFLVASISEMHSTERSSHVRSYFNRHAIPFHLLSGVRCKPWNVLFRRFGAWRNHLRGNFAFVSCHATRTLVSRCLEVDSARLIFGPYCCSCYECCFFPPPTRIPS